MYLTHKNKVNNPIRTDSGETIYELIGQDQSLGGSHNQSLAHVILSKDKSVAPHYHKSSEEVYYILSGSGVMVVDDEKQDVSKGDVIFIKPKQVHHLYNHNESPLEFLAISGPAWTPEDSYSV